MKQLFLTHPNWITFSVNSSEYKKYVSEIFKWKNRNLNENENEFKYRFLNCSYNDSYVEFISPQYFLQQFISAVENSNFAPKWNMFLDDLKNMNQISIISARGNQEDVIKDSINYVYKNILKISIDEHLPHVNVFCIYSDYILKKFNIGSKNTIAEIKFEIFKTLIDVENYLSYYDDFVDTVNFFNLKINELKYKNISVHLVE